MNGRQLAAPEEVFEAIPRLNFYQTANLAGEAGHDRWTHPVGADAESILDLEVERALRSLRVWREVNFLEYRINVAFESKATVG